ncbi:MAG: phosphoglycerate dehydrogenase [Eubacteriaceae bacterium]|nr:phosphoglycerate dehydrogenase [Eubacteriaceae bacterium]
MYRILTTHNIDRRGLDVLERAGFEYSVDMEAYQAILLKGRDINSMHFGDDLLAIARAGAHVSNVPVRECNEAGIVVFYTPGANANATKELTLASLILSSRDIVGAADFASSLAGDADPASKAEKAKSRFSGSEIAGKTLGVIGLGSVGSMVAEAAIALGMRVIGYDPYIDVAAAWNLPGGVERATDVMEMISGCDYVTVHVPSNAGTAGRISREFLGAMKDGARLINNSSASVADASAVREALEGGRLSCYVTDFPVPELCGVPGALVLPHIGSETAETEEKSSEMAAKALTDYLLYGNIRNSLNFPDCSMPWRKKTRISIVNFNVPSMISMMTTIVAKEGINIENMLNRSRDNIAYTLMDLDAPAGKCRRLIDELRAVGGIVRVRLIQGGE